MQIWSQFTCFLSIGFTWGSGRSNENDKLSLQQLNMEYQIEEINCAICMMVFKKPITIGCGHTFCYSCLNNSLKDHQSCPICRQHVSFTLSKMKVDERIQQIVQHHRLLTSKSGLQVKKQSMYSQCKAERLLLIDIVTEDLLLPFNRTTATFELQSNILISRMQRFVARQENPFNRYSTICKLIHIEEVRKNLFKGLIEALAFCAIESQEVESQQSPQYEDEEFFYRMCQCKEISQTTEANPKQFESFFHHFNQIGQDLKSKIIFSRINPNVFLYKDDPIALFYCILGIINVSKESKYKIAICFDQQQRINFVKEYLQRNRLNIKSKPSSLVHIPHQGGTSKVFIGFIFILVLMLYLSSREI